MILIRYTRPICIMNYDTSSQSQIRLFIFDVHHLIGFLQWKHSPERKEEREIEKVLYGVPIYYFSTVIFNASRYSRF